MQPSLSLRVSQHLALTPQLQQSIRLLQLSTLEMAQEVEQMLGDNPFLEREEGADMPAADSTSVPPDAPISIAADAYPESPAGQNDADYQPQDWEGDGSAIDSAHAEGEWGFESAPRSAASSASDDDEGLDAGNRADSHESLAAHLHRQALALRLGENDRAALYFLIESLSDDGYLEEPLEALAAALAASTEGEDYEALLHHLRVALYLLQHLEPAGVGAAHLAQCLQLQLQALEREEWGDPAVLATALRLCTQPLELLARRDLRRLAQTCQCQEDEVRAALAVIARLEPHPGRRFSDISRHALVPDVIVRKAGNDFRVQLNPEVMPRLRVHEVYANALRGQRGAEGHAGLAARLQEARWFIKNIQQRFDTILRVSEAIVERQKSFFVHGALAMRPLVLREIADELGLHESTISRVTSAKYMATPQGTFELKYFFGSGLSTETGGSASSTAVRALIKQLIEAENSAKPLSDSQLADMLKEQGIECARRTVAKYREALKIPTAALRKTL